MTVQTAQKAYFEHQCRLWRRSQRSVNPPGPKAATVSSWTLGTSPQMAWSDWAKIITINDLNLFWFGAQNLLWCHDFPVSEQYTSKRLDKLKARAGNAVPESGPCLRSVGWFGTNDDANEPWSRCGTRGRFVGLKPEPNQTNLPSSSLCVFSFKEEDSDIVWLFWLSPQTTVSSRAGARASILFPDGSGLTL